MPIGGLFTLLGLVFADSVLSGSVKTLSGLVTAHGTGGLSTLAPEGELKGHMKQGKSVSKLVNQNRIMGL